MRKHRLGRRRDKAAARNPEFLRPPGNDDHDEADEGGKEEEERCMGGLRSGRDNFRASVSGCHRRNSKARSVPSGKTSPTCRPAGQFCRLGDHVRAQPRVPPGIRGLSTKFQRRRKMSENKTVSDADGRGAPRRPKPQRKKIPVPDSRAQAGSKPRRGRRSFIVRSPGLRSGSKLRIQEPRRRHRGGSIGISRLVGKPWRADSLPCWSQASRFPPCRESPDSMQTPTIRTSCCAKSTERSKR